LSRISPSAARPEPATSIARALNQRLPEKISGAGTLYVWVRPGRTSAKAARALRKSRRAFEMVESCARIRLADGEVQSCTTDLVSALSRADAEETRALFMPGAAPPQLPDFSRMTTLHALDVLARSGWLLDQIAEGRFTSFFHPIVHARDTGRVFAHEALLRGVERDGSLVAPAPILTLAREAGLLSEVDSAACRTAIREAARHGTEMCVFINFSPAAIKDPKASLRTTQVLETYRRAGLRVALDDLGTGWSTLHLVHRLRPDFIKLDRELIRGVHLDPVKGLIAKKLLEIGHGMGIGTIVEGIEEEEELSWVCDHGADFVQGFLLGHPSAEVRA
jgi:EAL domain-containing protein (putative c-di-GMP-specific phosphodiesterase class I)